MFHSDDYQRVFRCSSTRLLSGIYVAHPSSIPREDISINCELFFLCKVSHVYDKRWINSHSCYFFFSQNSYIYIYIIFIFHILLFFAFPFFISQKNTRIEINFRFHFRASYICKENFHRCTKWPFIRRSPLKERSSNCEMKGK